MNHDFKKRLYDRHQLSGPIPSPKETSEWVENLLGILFPEMSDEDFPLFGDLDDAIFRNQLHLNELMQPAKSYIPKGIDFCCNGFYENIPKVYDLLLLDAEAITQGDPAAINKTEVLRTYPGFYAIAVYRIAHIFQTLEVPMLPRILTEYAHSKTGIDIHPGAIIGEKFCIDHGTGVVIGGTTIIGDRVKIYQGVTLGALSVKKELAKVKRHPTIEDDVVIYSGATILGGSTIIGKGSIIGGNVWLTKSVPENSRIYYKGNIAQRSITKNS